MTIPDEMLELYAFIFCQSGFRQLGMTFEQFLLVAATLKPADLPATREEALGHLNSSRPHSLAELLADAGTSAPAIISTSPWWS